MPRIQPRTHVPSTTKPDGPSGSNKKKQARNNKGKTSRRQLGEARQS